MSARATVESEWMRGGVRIALSPSEDTIVTEWASIPTCSRRVEGGTEPDVDAWLHIDEDSARAIYEALTDHFGHSGHDTRALRRDYDAERKRVDALIKNLIELKA